MSDQINSFDEVFHNSLSEHAVSPSDSSMGKIFATKISSEQPIKYQLIGGLGTMLLLLLVVEVLGGEEHAITSTRNCKSTITIENKTEKFI